MSESRRRSPFSWFSNLGVSTRIASAIALAAIVAIAVGVLSIQALTTTAGDAVDLAEQLIPEIEAAANLSETADGMLETTIRQALMLTSDAAAAVEQESLDLESDLRAQVTAILDAGTTADQSGMVAQVQAGLDAMALVRDEVLFPAGRTHDLAAWNEGLVTAATDVGGMKVAIADYRASVVAEATAMADEADAIAVTARNQVIALLVAGLLVALGLGFLVARKIVADLAHVSAACEALERGDLTVSSGLTSEDELGTMGKALDAAVVSLRSLVGSIDGSASSTEASSRTSGRTISPLRPGSAWGILKTPGRTVAICV